MNGTKIKIQTVANAMAAIYLNKDVLCHTYILLLL